MGLAIKTADLKLQAGASAGFKIGKSGSAGFIKFDKNLAKEMTQNIFTISTFFLVPTGSSTGSIAFFTSEFANHSFAGDTRNFDGIAFSTTPDGSDTKFLLRIREPDGSAGRTEYAVDVKIPTSSITLDTFHHIIISGNGGTVKCYFNDSAITDITIVNNESSFTPDASHLFLVGGTMGGGGDANNQVPVGSQLGYGHQNIFLDNQFVDLDTASNRRIFLNADGTPTTGTPQISSTDPVLFISGNPINVDNFENPGGAGSTHTVTRTNIFATGVSTIDVI